MSHPIIVEAMARERRRDLMREVEQRRLAKLARQGQPGMADRLLAGAGGLLSVAGSKLQERANPQASHAPGWAER